MSRILKPGAKVFIDIQEKDKWVSQAFENLNHTFAVVEEIKMTRGLGWHREEIVDKVLVKLAKPTPVNNISVAAKFHFDVDDLVLLPQTD